MTTGAWAMLLAAIGEAGRMTLAGEGIGRSSGSVGSSLSLLHLPIHHHLHHHGLPLHRGAQPQPGRV